MIYERLEQAPAWVEALDLAVLVYNLTTVASDAFKAKDSLKQQIELSTLSVSNAIASGFERNSADLHGCLQKAVSATGEIRSMLGLMERLPSLSPYFPLISDLKAKNDRCATELKEWAKTVHAPGTNGHSHADSAKEEERRRIAREKRAVFEGLRQLNGA
jgi:four helix bundle protein